MGENLVVPVSSFQIEKVFCSNPYTENFNTMHNRTEKISCCMAAQGEVRKGEVPKSTNMLAELSQRIF